jgi:small GTP-binding protein
MAARKTNAFSRLIFIGDSGVGKTSLMSGLLGQEFSGLHCVTTAADFRALEFLHQGHAIRIQLWDTAGQEMYRSITRMYFRNAQIVLLCFDISSRDSFQSLDEWKAMITEEVPAARVLLIATKEDLMDDPKHQWNVSINEATSKAAAYGVPFIATSARTKNGIESLKFLIGDAVLEGAERTASSNETIGNVDAETNEKKCC